MTKPNLPWEPFSLNDLCTMLAGLDGWFLDGGCALDVFLQRSTRKHEDIDVGVFSLKAEDLLAVLTEAGLRILKADKGGLTPYDPVGFDAQHYNYWIATESAYRMQLLVYPVSDGRVSFRRNTSVSWPIGDFTLRQGTLQIINPLVSYAFKVTADAQAKDLKDIALLMSELVNLRR